MMSNCKYYTVVFLALLYCVYNYWDRTVGFHAVGTFGMDFWCYVGDRPCWLYLPILKMPFYLYRFIPWQVALVNWYCLQSVFVVYVVLKLMELPYGRLLSLSYLKVIGWTIAIGNIDPTLAALCVSASGSLVAGIFKPYLFAFSGVAAYKGIRRDTYTLSHYYTDETGIPMACPHRGVWQALQQEVRAK